MNGVTAYEQADPDGRELIMVLSQTGLPVPDVGEEVDGIPVEISWPTHKIAVTLGLDSDERQDLADSGWTLCEPQPDIVRTALQKGDM